MLFTFLHSNSKLSCTSTNVTIYSKLSHINFIVLISIFFIRTWTEVLAVFVVTIATSREHDRELKRNNISPWVETDEFVIIAKRFNVETGWNSLELRCCWRLKTKNNFKLRTNLLYMMNWMVISLVKVRLISTANYHHHHEWISFSAISMTNSILSNDRSSADELQMTKIWEISVRKRFEEDAISQMRNFIFTWLASPLHQCQARVVPNRWRWSHIGSEIQDFLYFTTFSSCHRRTMRGYFKNLSLIYI